VQDLLGNRLQTWALHFHVSFFKIVGVIKVKKSEEYSAVARKAGAKPLDAVRGEA
jgi:hypothetical protein